MKLMISKLGKSIKEFQHLLCSAVLGTQKLIFFNIH